MSCLLDRLAHHARDHPDRLALSDDHICLSYGALERQTTALAAVLAHRGVAEGDCIGCLKQSMVPVCITALAALKIGAAIVPLDERENATKIEHIFKTARVKRILYETQTGADIAARCGVEAEGLSELLSLEHSFAPPAKPSGAQIWSIEPTSGSSGLPKLVPLSGEVLDHYIEAHATAADLRPDDKIALFGEMWFDTVFSSFWSGAQACFYDFRGKGAAGIVPWLRAQEITGFQSYPVAFRAIAENASEPFPKLRFIRLAGEAILPRDVAEFERLCPEGAVLTNSYGSTECGLLACFDFVKGDRPPDGPLPAGYPPVAGELSIVDKDGHPVMQGVAGVIVKRSRYLAEHYLHNPKESKGVYWTEADGRRALYTGDLGYFDSEGCLHLIGRIDDQVKIRGYSVRYSEVEAEISKDSGFAELAVTSWLNPQGVRQLVCHYAADAGRETNAREYRARLMERVPAYMVPNYFISHKALPKTDSGKIKRQALPTPDTVRERGNIADESLTATEQDVAQIWQEVLGHSDYTARDDFFDIGGDSLQAMSALVALEERHKVRLGYESFIMQGASIVEIANRIDDAPCEDMVTLKSGAGGPPVFVMPVENGEFSDWLYMMTALGESRSYFGVHVRDITERAQFKRQSLVDLARYACDTIEREHGLGPMVIAGFSAGTVLALEVAREMTARGGDDLALVLLEPTAPKFQTERFSWWLRRIVSPLVKQGDLRRMLNRCGHILFKRPSQELPVADETAFRRHRPQPINLGKVLMFSCLEENPKKGENEAYWQTMVGGAADIEDATGNHVHCVRDPNAAVLAHKLETWIDKKFPDISSS